MKYYVTIDQERLSGLYDVRISPLGEVTISQQGSAVHVFGYCLTVRLQDDDMCYMVRDAQDNKHMLWLEFAV